MPIQEFKDTLNIILKQLPTIKRIMLVGGEPFLHPQLIEILEYATSIIPDNIKFHILTNGIILDKDIDKYLSVIKNHINTSYIVTQYPTVEYKNLTDIKDKQITYLATRLFFNAPSISLDKDNISHYSNCSLYTLPCLIVKNYKVFICPFAACASILQQHNINLDLDQTNYLDLYDITEEKIIDFILNEEKSLCHYCQQGTKANQYWAQGQTSLDQLLGVIDNENGYLQNYEEYNLLYNGSQLLPLLTKEKRQGKQYKDFLDLEYMVKGWKYYANDSRLKKKLDIIIPYYSVTEQLINKLIITLKNQSFINNCCIYMISDHSPNEALVYNTMKNVFNNIVFLKTSKNVGPGMARQLGIDNSYSPFFTFLDVDDLYQYPNALYDLYKAIIDQEYDYAFGYVNECENGEMFLRAKLWNPTNIVTFHSVIYRRTFIEKNQIKFHPELRIYEDLYYRLQVTAASNNYGCTNTFTYRYNKNSYDQSIGKTTNKFQKYYYYCKALFSFIYDNWGKQYLDLRFKKNIELCLYRLIMPNTINNNEIVCNIYYVALLQQYLKIPKELWHNVIHTDTNEILDIVFDKNLFYIVNNNQILNTIDDYQNYIYIYLEEGL